jgi:hypothetical protein
MIPFEIAAFFYIARYTIGMSLSLYGDGKNYNQKKLARADRFRCRPSATRFNNFRDAR